MLLIDKEKIYEIIAYNIPKEGQIFLGVTGTVRRAKRDFDLKPGNKYFFILRKR